jgi:hypothetical protein
MRFNSEAITHSFGKLNARVLLAEEGDGGLGHTVNVVHGS